MDVLWRYDAVGGQEAACAVGPLTRRWVNSPKMWRRAKRVLPSVFRNLLYTLGGTL